MEHRQHSHQAHDCCCHHKNHDAPGHGHHHHHHHAQEQAVPKEPLGEGTVYTCPMHPQLRQIGPGSCPICGMALEPEVATLETGPNPELVDMTRRFWIGLVLTIPVFLLEMGGHLVDLHSIVAQQTSNWIQL